MHRVLRSTVRREKQEIKVHRVLRSKDARVRLEQKVKKDLKVIHGPQ
eukprot:COSAG06_NODE_45304_length_356_cov_0.556420_2_plen_46_part_01